MMMLTSEMLKQVEKFIDDKMNNLDADAFVFSVEQSDIWVNRVKDFKKIHPKIPFFRFINNKGLSLMISSFLEGSMDGMKVMIYKEEGLFHVKTDKGNYPFSEILQIINEKVDKNLH